MKASAVIFEPGFAKTPLEALVLILTGENIHLLITRCKPKIIWVRTMSRSASFVCSMAVLLTGILRAMRRRVGFNSEKSIFVSPTAAFSFSRVASIADITG
ncbi:hypothetical protein Barb4_04077 [Bacteroidales bacterium Barb4]|nr:hypothetical protein Barb4_04077 [Bacteroidales bacterium Barb4]